MQSCTERRQIERDKSELTRKAIWDKDIVTEIRPITNFFEAEEYHHDYLKRNPQNPYCQMVVRPKYDKFKSVFSDALK